jgi:ribosome-associated protein
LYLNKYSDIFELNSELYNVNFVLRICNRFSLLLQQSARTATQGCKNWFWYRAMLTAYGGNNFARDELFWIAEMILVSKNIIIQNWEITESFVRASGPGGQNVNKVSTSVVLRFEAARSPNLTEPVKQRLKDLAGRRWNNDGAIILQVDETRSQIRNREIAQQRLIELILLAIAVPKRRRLTKPTRGSLERRLKAKKERGNVKNLRGKSDLW